MKTVFVVVDHGLEYVFDGEGSVAEYTPFPCMAFERREDADAWVKDKRHSKRTWPPYCVYEVNSYAAGEVPT